MASTSHSLVSSRLTLPGKAGPLRLDAMAGTGETDSVAEEMGFEPLVSPKIDRAFEIALSPLRHSRSASETGSFCERDRRFESVFLQQRVRCELRFREGSVDRSAETTGTMPRR